MTILPYDVQAYLCTHILDLPTIRELSRCNHQLRQITLPLLFRDVVVKIRGNWGDAENGVTSLSRCPQIFSFIRSFRIDVYISDQTNWLGWRKDRMLPRSQFPAQLCEVVKTMTNLRSLAFVLPEANMDLFEEAFDSSRFSSITHLTLGPYSHFLIAECPSLRVVQTDSSRWLHSRRGMIHREHTLELFSAVAGRKLECLSVLEWWTTDLTKALLRAIPDIPELRMLGGRYSDPIYKHVPILAEFTHLTHLRLAAAGELRAGFEPAGCGNIYIDDPGYAELENQYERVTEDKIVRRLASQCQRLESVEFDAWTRISILRDVSGQAVEFVRAQPKSDS